MGMEGHSRVAGNRGERARDQGLGNERPRTSKQVHSFVTDALQSPLLLPLYPISDHKLAAVCPSRRNKVGKCLKLGANRMSRLSLPDCSRLHKHTMKPLSWRGWGKQVNTGGGNNCRKYLPSFLSALFAQPDEGGRKE